MVCPECGSEKMTTSIHVTQGASHEHNNCLVCGHGWCKRVGDVEPLVEEPTNEGE